MEPTQTPPKNPQSNNDTPESAGLVNTSVPGPTAAEASDTQAVESPTVVTATETQSSSQPQNPTSGNVLELNVERQFLKLVGATVRTFDINRNLICKAEQKAFKLKEDIPFYNDESKTNEVFRIRARRIIDLGATYDITDPSGNLIGSLKRQGLASTFVRDTWLILNASGQEIGKIVEDSSLLGLLRRYIDFVALFVPQKFTISIQGQVVGNIRQNKNPFTVKLNCIWQPVAVSSLGSILVYAVPSMLAIIEARQN